MKNNRFYIFIGILVILALAIWSGIVFISRQGKIKVTIQAAPKDSLIMIDGKKSKVGDVYVEPGEHMFVASKNGFLEDRKKTTISEGNNYVGLLPTAESKEAVEWSNKNSQAREAIGSIIANQRGEMLRNKASIINKLPYMEIAGPFRIDYGISSASNTAHPYLIIHYTTAESRQKALGWIRKQGHEPTDLDIRFTDFSNPLTSEAKQ